jgi:hypothetical protein
MSFIPIGLPESLLGSALITTDVYGRLFANSKASPKNFYKKPDDSSTRSSHTILMIIMSAMIFVAMISTYDVIRNAVNMMYAKMSLEDPRSENSEHDITRTLIVNHNAFISSIIFCVVAISFAVIGVSIILHVIKNAN